MCSNFGTKIDGFVAENIKKDVLDISIETVINILNRTGTKSFIQENRIHTIFFKALFKDYSSLLKII